ncbi:MAG: endonuclease MutS2 [Cyanobacteria bacterium P01_F01_bin.33]
MNASSPLATSSPLEIGPDIRAETLQLLEWPRLCEHLASFASTEIGAAVARTLLPWRSRSESERLLAETGEAIALELLLPGGVPMQGIRDLEPYVQRAELGGMLRGRELNDIAFSLAAARKARRTIDARESIPLLQDMVSVMRTYPELEREIVHCVDERGEIDDRASETLTSLRLEMRGIRERVRDKLQRLISMHGTALQEAVLTVRDGRYVLPMKATHRDAISGTVRDSSGSGATLYVEPNSVARDNDRLRQLEGKERREEERILSQLSASVGEVADGLRQLQAAIAQLDLTLARGRYSTWNQGEPPIFSDANALRLLQVRHPLLVWQAERSAEIDPETAPAVVPINLAVAETYRVVVITGPNTGGKTVALKTLGLMALMAKAGLYLPAEESAELPWFEGVYADIGDEQSLEQNLSTFSGHIRRIGRVLDAVSDRALVLLDEVGAGTDPTEGTALATSLLEHLGQTALLTVASTHYSALKALKYQHSHFENASVEFDIDTLAPTYRLLWGIPGRSQALAIAGRLGLEASLIDRARALLHGDEHRVEDAIVGLERQRAEHEAKLRSLESMQRQLEGLQRQMEAKSEHLRELEATLNARQARAVDEEIQSARKEVAAVIRQLKKGKATGQKAQTTAAQLDRLQTQWIPSAPKVETEFYPEVGDRVRLRGLGQKGEVIAIDDADVTVRSGLLKFSVSLNQIEPLDEVQAKQRQRAKPAPAQPAEPAPQVRTSQNTLDLRGMRIAEAEREIEDAIAIAPPGPFWLIHGRGTGKLKAGVREYLKSHPRINGFADAAANEGGSGVTVAQLGQ